MGKILIIEDSESIRKLYKEALDHDLTLASNISEGLQLAREQSFDLLLIDLNLPDGDGFHFCKKLKAQQDFIPPFIFVTGRFDIQDKLTGFALGAEDYIIKPFDPAELKARVQLRMLKQSSSDTSNHHSQAYGFIIDAKNLRLVSTSPGIPSNQDLTPNEYRLLQVLMANSGQVLSRSALLEKAWGANINVLERTIDRHISSLRRKLGEAARFIEAVPGKGYCWQSLEDKEVKRKQGA